MEHDINLFNSWSIADLISIGGSKAGALGTSRSNFFSYSWSFRQKSCQIIGFATKSQISALVWEILDPPLITIHWLSIITARKRSCGKVIFLHLSVILFTGGGEGVYLSMQWAWGVHPLDTQPPRQTPTWTPNPWAFYWNAFLLWLFLFAFAKFYNLNFSLVFI